MKIPHAQPAGVGSMVVRCIAFIVAASALLVSLCAAALGTSLEQAFFLTLGQIAHMAIHYPLWAWFLFLALLVAGTRVWGLIGAALMFYPISSIVYRFDVRIIAATGADTSDLIFALGHFHRLVMLAAGFLLFVVIPTLIWRRKKLNLDLTHACFWFRLGKARRPEDPVKPGPTTMRAGVGSDPAASAEPHIKPTTAG